MTIDLHMHTTASDGDYAPEALIELAKDHGVTTLAVTDHDTTDGIAAARRAAATHNITVINGVELSAETGEDGDVHMLGYFIDLTDGPFQSHLAAFRENRYHRGRAIVRKLNEIGVSLAFEAVSQQADGAPITRPHIARALVVAGHVPDLQTAFDRYLADDAPAYVSRMKMTPEEAVDIIHAAGGAAVLAHPGLVARYEPIIERLAAHGLDGVELNHPKNPPEVKARVSQLAAVHNLVLTGGSDFHRPTPEGEILLGQYNPPEGALVALEARREKSDA